MGAGAVEGRLAGSPLVVAPILLGLALRFHPLEDLLAAFLERAQGLVQGVLNRFSRCCGVASQFGLFNHFTLAGDAFFEFTDSLVSLGEKSRAFFIAISPCPNPPPLRASLLVPPGSSS
jgi:hypothetical protein